MTREEEQRLLRKAARGSTDAFAQIVTANEAMVYRLALKMLGSREDAEDAAQETFLKAYQSLGSFHGDCRLSVWLYRIADHVCIDLLRKRRDAVSLNDGEDGAEWELPDERFDPVALTERKLLREEIGAALAALPGDAREILVLRELEGKSYEEIAETLSLDLGTVKSRIFRARKKLCVLLEKEGNISNTAPSKKEKGGVQA